MHIETGSIVALVLYFAILIGIGLANYKSKEDLEGYG